MRRRCPRLAGHFFVSVLLGMVAWILLAVVALKVARGALYGWRPRVLGSLEYRLGTLKYVMN